MESTKNYKIFKLLPYNRPVDEKHATKIKAWLQQEAHGLKTAPIIVTKDMQVVDGQHRLWAAREAGAIVYYVMTDHFNPIDIIRRNQVTKRWMGEDYVRFYAHNGTETQQRHYQDLIRFAKDHNLAQGEAAAIMCHRSEISRLSIAAGDFVFTQDEDLVEALKNARLIAEGWHEIAGEHHQLPSRWIVHIAMFLLEPLVNASQFIKKLDSVVTRLRPHTSVFKSYENLCAAYNYRLVNHRLVPLKKALGKIKLIRTQEESKFAEGDSE